MKEQMSIGGISKSVSNEVESLWNEYKLPQLENDCSIISADFGNLGSLVIRRIASYDKAEPFKYEGGSYDYVSVKSDLTTRILWTDYSDTEPYNRQGGLYCDGATFEHLGSPVIENDNYREFIANAEYNSNISFAVWGYRFNDFYNSITFGICLKTDKVDEFVSKLRQIIGSLHNGVQRTGIADGRAIEKLLPELSLIKAKK